MPEILSTLHEWSRALESVFYNSLPWCSSVQEYQGAEQLEEYLQGLPERAYPLGTPFLVYFANSQIFSCTMTWSGESRNIQSLEEVNASSHPQTSHKVTKTLNLKTITFPGDTFPGNDTFRTWLLALPNTDYTLNESFHVIFWDESRFSVLIYLNAKIMLEDVREMMVHFHAVPTQPKKSH